MAVLVGAFALMASTQPLALADDQNPQELWKAYPLNPGDEKGEPADPAPTPTSTAGAGATPAATVKASATPAPAKDGGGGLLAPLLLGGVVVAFAVGLGAGRVARRRRRATAPAEAEAHAPAPPMAVVIPPDRPSPPREHPKARSRREERRSRETRNEREPTEERAARRPPEERKPRAEPREERSARKSREERKPAAPPPSPPPAAPPEPARPRRFARRPWPREAERAWTCVIDWKPGYLRSRFRAMVAPPGKSQREPFAQSRSRWTFMDEPEPPTQDMVEVVRELVAELVEAGWVPIDRSGAWYAQRFLWAGRGQPRPLAPQKGKEADV